MEQKRIRGIIVSDSIPEIVKRTIEMLNEQLQGLELYGIELKRYCSMDKEIRVIVPSLIGTTPKSARKIENKKRKWSYKALQEYYSEQIEDHDLKERLLALLHWSIDNKVFVESIAKSPAFGIRNVATGQRIVTVYSDGRLGLCFGPACEDYYPDPSLRHELVKDFIELKMLEKTQDPNEKPYGKKTIRSIRNLSEEEFKQLLDILAKYSGITNL